MTLDNNKDIIRQFVAEFKNKGNFDIVDDLFAEDFAHQIAIPGLPSGREGMKAVGAVVYSAFPDVKVEIKELIAEGDFVVEKTIAKATHKGDFAGFPASGDAVEWSETNIYRVTDGKVAEFIPETNMMATLMMKQMQS